MAEVIEYVVLRRVLGLFADRRRWTKLALARTEAGAETDPLDQSAVRWCVRGAIRKEAYEITGDRDAALAVAARCEAVMGRTHCIEDWQDCVGLVAVRKELREVLEAKT